MKKLLLFVFVSLFLISFISAVPPLMTVQQSQDTGIAIQYPEIFIMKQNANMYLHFHLFNYTNKKPLNSSITCLFHLYNSTGNHIYIQSINTVEHDYDYTFDINGGNFSDTGDYSYIVQCNNSVIGGYVSVPFLVTKTGSDVLTIQQSILYIIVFLITILFLISTMIGAILIPWKDNRNDEGKVISVNDLKYFKIVLWFFSYLEFLFIIYVLRNLTDYYLNSVGIFEIFNIIFTVMLILLLPFFPALVFFTIITWLSDKTNYRKLMGGFDIK